MSSDDLVDPRAGQRAYSELGGLLVRVEEHRRLNPRRPRITQQPWWRTLKVTLTWTGLSMICILLVGAAMIAVSGRMPQSRPQPRPVQTPSACVAAPQPGQLLPVCHYPR